MSTIYVPSKMTERKANGGGAAVDCQKNVVMTLLATDEDYDECRNSGLADGKYLQRRKSLLNRKVKERRLFTNQGKADRRMRYLDRRKFLLAKQYESRSSSSSLDLNRSKKSSKITISDELKAKLPGAGKVNDAYAFTGMHHIFDHHSKAVTSIYFANDNKNLIAFGSDDGSVSVCSAMDDPKVLHHLKGHKAPVTDLAWSMSNEILLSCSLDGTVCAWDVQSGDGSGKCIRTVDTGTTKCLCCMFHPLNNNLFLVGTDSNDIKFVNLSTGRISFAFPVGSTPVTTLTIDPAGQYLFVGDKGGILYTYNYSMRTGGPADLERASTIRVVREDSTGGGALTSVAYKGWNRSTDHSPELLVTSSDNCMRLFSITSVPLPPSPSGTPMKNKLVIALQREFRFPTWLRSRLIRSCFCPLISMRDGACVVSGSSDNAVRLYDVLRKSPQNCVTELMGHAAAVLDVSWNYDESLLASCDATGVVILWKRITMAGHVQPIV
eukprot:TRINITY_DN1716_c0_g1_i1.p1 TRINITY_DN1716_c0_g1~~TRINITY_DN1716_c0_g1_i1.p1  ORF type:complete len:494 (+),score=80.94 TRINITY_DN1716_c0_g1_i1:51-1532(+)